MADPRTAIVDRRNTSPSRPAGGRGWAADAGSGRQRVGRSTGRRVRLRAGLWIVRYGWHLPGQRAGGDVRSGLLQKGPNATPSSAIERSTSRWIWVTCCLPKERSSPRQKPRCHSATHRPSAGVEALAGFGGRGCGVRGPAETYQIVADSLIRVPFVPSVPSEPRHPIHNHLLSGL